MRDEGETIYALSSASGRAGIAVIRISGPEAPTVYCEFTGLALDSPRQFRRAELSDPADGKKLDDSLVVFFPHPNSYTGEDVVEFHVHGGVAVSTAVLTALAGRSNMRIAEPGEFTKRAVFAGKMDLTEAEGVIDLIDAETEAQRRQALRQSAGALRQVYEKWVARLSVILAHLEAEIDFPDEDLPTTIFEKEKHEILCLIDELTIHLDDSRRGERLRSGLLISIIGPPNAGKSSLLNLLARREAAIVSARAGTTRDVVEAHLDLGGYPVVVADTAGIRETEDEVEKEGVRRALDVAKSSDLKIAIFDAAAPPPPLNSPYIDRDTMVVFNKIDKAPVPAWVGPAGVKHFGMSATGGEGVEIVLVALQQRIADLIGNTELPSITRVRHREAVTNCVESLRRSLGEVLPELAAEEVRLAVRALGRITGGVDVEGLLDVIFRDFCIGK